MLSTSSTTTAAELPQTARQRSPGRPFEKGRSGNAAGRSSKPADVGALCRKHARAAIRTLVAALASPDPQAAVAAAQTLIEHGHGAAIQHVALHVPRISVLCRAGDPEGDRANGEDAKASRAWDA